MLFSPGLAVPSGWMGSASTGFPSAVCSSNKELAGFHLVGVLLLNPATETTFLSVGAS